SHSYKPNLYKDSISLRHNVASLAYMDDTQWLSGSQTNLERILTIADDFYTLNNIKVNKSKSVLLMKKPNVPYQPLVSLHFGSEQVDIRPLQFDESTRILGVWFNMNNDRC